MPTITKIIGICVSVLLIYFPIKAVAQDDLLGYVNQNYLGADANYGNIPVHKFNSLGAVKRFDSQNNEIASRVTQAVLTKSACIKCSISFKKMLETKDGSFVHFRIVKPHTSIDAVAVLDEYTVTEYSGFALLRNNKVVLPAIKLTTEDQEIGGFERELWDVFEFEKLKYLLVYTRHYESQLFEIYLLGDDELLMKFEFEFGGL